VGLIVAVLAGGRSRRMGRDKAAIDVDGESMLKKVCKAAGEVGFHVLVVGRERAELPSDLRGWIDAMPDDGEPRGPLGGLATALRADAGTDVILCGCDLPLVTAKCFEWLVSETLSSEGEAVQAVIPLINGREQLLFGWYSADVLSIVMRQLETDQLAMRQLLTRLKVRFVDVPPHLASALQDVDTMEELRQLNDARGAGLQ